MTTGLGLGCSSTLRITGGGPVTFRYWPEAESRRPVNAPCSPLVLQFELNLSAVGNLPELPGQVCVETYYLGGRHGS